MKLIFMTVRAASIIRFVLLPFSVRIEKSFGCYASGLKENALAICLRRNQRTARSCAMYKLYQPLCALHTFFEISKSVPALRNNMISRYKVLCNIFW